MQSSMALLPVLRSETQGSLLAALMIGDHAGETLSELADTIGADPSTVLREVDRLEGAGIVTTRRVGRSRLVDVNDDNPLTGPLRELIVRSLGPEPMLRQALTPIDGVEQAFIFGSWAAAAEGGVRVQPDDIDLLVIGVPDRDEVLDAVMLAERRLGRAIDVTFRTPTEWAATNDPFINTVRDRPLVQIR
jgi:DNA-binding transcriptional ArsR family regulator